MNKFWIVLGVAVAFHGQSYAQDFNDFEDMSFEEFRQAIHKDFESFRQKCNEEYAEFLKDPWKAFKEERPVPKPKEEPMPPVVCPEDDQMPAPRPVPLPYDEIIPVPKPVPQPQPVGPIEEEPIPNVVPEMKLSFFGTGIQVRFDRSKAFRLNGTNETAIGCMWKDLSDNPAYSTLLSDCLQLREELHLSDWPYLEMLHAIAENIYGKDCNEATLLMAYLYCQSGYKMRLARDEAGALYMCYASRHHIYDISYYVIDGNTYFIYGTLPKGQVYISQVAFPREQSLSLLLPELPTLAMAATEVRSRQSSRYPDMKITFSSNKNLMDFYSTYPTSMIGDNVVSRWAMYANTPMDVNMREQIYPDLRNAISGCSQLEAVNKLLNFVQTGFEYEYDDKVWGDDRAFFAEESLYYPYCDCEDRSILFTKLVRDLLGLRCILVFYPGHLASAVEFTQEEVNGDYIQLGNRKFTIADGTYINAPVGKTMPDMDNRSAKVILLEAY